MEELNDHRGYIFRGEIMTLYRMNKKHILWIDLHCHILDLWSVPKHFLVLKQKIKQRKLLVVAIACYVSLYLQIILIHFISISFSVCVWVYMFVFIYKTYFS